MIKSVKEAQINSGTRVLVRCDIDVPVKSGKVEDYFRLEHNLETLKYLKEKNAKIILAGHIGQPNLNNTNDIKSLSTKVLKPFFDKHLGNGSYELLENLRFDIGEIKNDMQFAKSLATKTDVYVNDCFATSHRKHASIVSLPTLLPAYAGLQLLKEIQYMKMILDSPKKPLIIIIGGAKIESKKPTIDKFLSTADYVLLGGKMGQDWKKQIPHNLLLPIDYVNNNRDIGPKTIQNYIKIISYAKTLVWAGPMGAIEEKENQRGTKEIIKAIDMATTNKCLSVVGGGNTIAAINDFNSDANISFKSTGGGAMLEFLTKETLVGIEALK